VSVLPFLTTFAIPRSGDEILPGRYAAEEQVWVVDGPTGSTPIVTSTTKLSELATKTDVRQEQDDPGVSTLIELITKTANLPEQDDYPGLQMGWQLQLMTVTKVTGERPDFDPDCY
jgi:hypothetical protein